MLKWFKLNKKACKGPISRVLSFIHRLLCNKKDDHLSRPTVTDGLKRSTRTTMQKHTLISSLFDLAPGGVYPANSVTRTAVRFYRTFSPLPSLNGSKT